MKIWYQANLIRLVLVLFVASLLTACGNTEKMNLVIQANNTAIIESITAQKTTNDTNQRLSMIAFSEAMVKASSTTDKSDDAAVAMAWGYSLGQKQEVIIPNLQGPERAKDAGDYARDFAFLVPYINMWLYDSSDEYDNSPSISASGGSTILYQSANPSGNDNFLPILSTVDFCADGNCSGSSEDYVDDPTTDYYDPGGVGCSSYESWSNGFCVNPFTG